MIEGLIVILFLSFVGLIIALVGNWGVLGVVLVILQALGVITTGYLLVRVRVKISRAEKEKLKAKIEDLEKKINSVTIK